jgi:branched-chain amino acid transport system permease protein
MILQATVNGVMFGSVYALVAAGLTLVFGVMKIINIAHGEFFMLAMYGYFFLHQLLGLNPYVSIPIVTFLSFLLGYCCFRVLIRPVLINPPINKLLITLGLSLILANMALFFFKADYRSLNLSFAASKFEFYSVFFTWAEFIAFFGSVIVTSVLYWTLRYTKLGIYIRAVSQNPDAAALVGIDVQKVYGLSFGIAASCASIAGGLLSPIYYVFPEVGLTFLLISFVIIVLGGMGNFLGALAGGIIVGLVESLSAMFMPGSSAPLVIFVVFILILLIRPQGLLR